MGELKPCPFCGGEAFTFEQDDNRDCHAECEGCGNRTSYQDSMAEARRLWNQRALDKPTEEVTEAMVEAGREAYTAWQQSFDPRQCSLGETIYRAMRRAALQDGV